MSPQALWNCEADTNFCVIYISVAISKRSSQKPLPVQMPSALKSTELFLANHERKCAPWTGADQGRRLAAFPAGVSVCAQTSGTPRLPPHLLL